MRNHITLIAAALLVAASVEAQMARPNGRRGANKPDAVANATRTAFLGVYVDELDPVLAHHLKLKPGLGIVVRDVASGSPAADVLAAEDVLTELDGQWLVNADQFVKVVRMHKPGDEVAIKFIHEGRPGTATVKLAGRDDNEDDAMAPQSGFRTMPMPGLRNGFPRGWNAITPPGADDEDGATLDPLPLPEPSPKHGNSTVRSQTRFRTSSTFNDNGRTATLSNDNGEKQLKITDEDGKVLFDGPVNTDDQIKKIPDNCRELYEKVAGQSATIKFKTIRRKSPPQDEKTDV